MIGAALYIGINGGWGSSHNCWDFANRAALCGSEGCHNANGGTVGGQVGYRWQTGPMVFGLEAQGDWAIYRQKSPACRASTPASINRSNLDAFGLFTGQIGYAWNNVLLYAKGGAAVTDDSYNSVFTGAGGVVSTSTRAINPLGRRYRRRHRIRLRAELVGGHRVRSPVHGQPKSRFTGITGPRRSPELSTLGGDADHRHRFASTTAWAVRSSRSTESAS